MVAPCTQAIHKVFHSTDEANFQVKSLFKWGKDIAKSMFFMQNKLNYMVSDQVNVVSFKIKSEDQVQTA